MLRRQPNIYLFNPTCEYAVANGHASWQPNRVLQKMESDLATLPQFFTQPNDFVLVDKLPSHEFISSVEELHFQSPHFLSTKEALAKPSFLELQKNKLCPWGWSPAAHKLLAPLKPSCSDDFSRSPVSQWKPEYRNFYSKKFARGILERLLSDFPSEQFLPPAMLTRVCTTNQEIEALLENWGKIMVKAPWSSSGRGLQPITKTPVHPKVWEKTAGILREQGYAIVEPFCDKALDLAFEFEFKKGKVTFLGVSYFLTDGKGQYQGNYLNGLPCSIPSEVKKFAGKIS
ncbi:MAG: hypothetical protein J7L95_03110, partial [Prolixibacteraceae bacterium]|nr:hypothetical protein [Prolixibacteraceae bacterium]